MASAVGEVISKGNSIHDRYVDEPGVLFNVPDVGVTFPKKPLQKQNQFDYCLQMILLIALSFLILLSFP